MPPNRYATAAVLAEIRRLKAALHREGKAYRCEPDPPGMWRPTREQVRDAADWLDGEQPSASCQIDTGDGKPPT